MTLALAAADTISGIAGSATSITYTISGDEITSSGDAFKVLAQGQLGSTAGTLYTVPASTSTIIKSIHLANPSASDVTAKLTVKGTAAANVILPAISIVAGGFAVFGSDGWVFYNDSGQRLGEGAKGDTGPAGADGAAGADGDMTNPMTTQGDVIYGGASGTPARLGIGTAAQVLTVNAGATAPEWADAAAGGGGGITQAYIGYNTIGGSFEAATVNRQYMKKITVAAGCFLTSIDIYVKGNGSNVIGLLWGLLNDNSGTPLNIIGGAAALSTANNVFYLNTTARWVSLPLGIYVAAGDYWPAILSTSAAMSIAYDGSGADKYINSGGTWIMDGSQGTITATTNKYSIRLNTLS